MASHHVALELDGDRVVSVGDSSRRYIREDSGFLASVTVGAWAYPREVSSAEIYQGRWYRFGDEAIVWFLEIPETTGWIQVHVCSNPGVQGMIGTPRAMVVLEVLAELMGGTRLYAILPDGIGELSDREKAVTRRYLRMRGWTEDCLGMYTELGG